MSSFDKIITFHGTSDAIADELIKGNVDVTLGGGELGQGFYLGNELYIAKAWAMQRHNSKSVVEFHIDDDDFWNFDIECLTSAEALEWRCVIRTNDTTRTHHFHKDIIWSDIVGGAELYCYQHKWESSKGQSYLNSHNVLRLKR